MSLIRFNSEVCLLNMVYVDVGMHQQRMLFSFGLAVSDVINTYLFGHSNVQPYPNHASGVRKSWLSLFPVGIDVLFTIEKCRI